MAVIGEMEVNVRVNRQDNLWLHCIALACVCVHGTLAILFALASINHSLWWLVGVVVSLGQLSIRITRTPATPDVAPLTLTVGTDKATSALASIMQAADIAQHPSVTSEQRAAMLHSIANVSRFVLATADATPRG